MHTTFRVLTEYQVTRLFQERLQAWKHAVVYLEDYIIATEKTHHTHGKEYEKILKVQLLPLRLGDLVVLTIHSECIASTKRRSSF